MLEADVVAPGDSITTDATSSAELHWANGTRWEVLPNSEVSIKNSEFNTRSLRSFSQLNLTKGKMMARVTLGRQPQGALLIVTSAGVIAKPNDSVGLVSALPKTPPVEVFKGTVDMGTYAGKRAPSAHAGQVLNAQGQPAALTPAEAAKFARYPGISQPPLDVFVQPGLKGTALLHIVSEATAHVAVDGRLGKTKTPGVWNCRVPLHPGVNHWQVVALDEFGLTHIVNQTFTAPPLSVKYPPKPASRQRRT